MPNYHHLWSTAVHEAGHAAIAHCLGASSAVLLTWPDRGECRARIPESASDTVWIAKGMLIDCAGEVAQALAPGDHAGAWDAAADDRALFGKGYRLLLSLGGAFTYGSEPGDMGRLPVHCQVHPRASPVALARARGAIVRAQAAEPFQYRVSLAGAATDFAG